MPKECFLLLFVIVFAAISSAQMGQASRQPQPDISNAIVGSTLSCSLPHTFVVAPRLIEKARLKARLLILLRDSLYDDASGIVNIAREKEIKKLANKLRNERDD